jgi:hypothetical protein
MRHSVLTFAMPRVEDDELVTRLGGVEALGIVALCHNSSTAPHSEGSGATTKR